MTSPLADSSPVEYWRAWCSYCPGAAFEENERFTRFITGAPFAPCNQVALCDLPATGIEAQVAEILAPFRERSLPMLWSVSPSVRPRNLGDALQAGGFTAGDSMAGMALDLALMPEPDATSALTIERVTDDSMLRVWGKTYHDGFGLPAGFAETFVATFKQAGFGAETPFLHYVGLLDGTPVACSTMFLGAGACPACPERSRREPSRRAVGLWHIATLPHARRRGIGAAMTLAPLLDARELGYALGVLYASKMGASVYRRLGFREHCAVTQYQWPAQTEAPP